MISSASGIFLALIGLVLTPVLGGLIAGFDRILTAKLQSRKGPPLLQPFYDIFKLWGKSDMVVNSWQILCAWIYLFSTILAMLFFLLQADLLVIFFILLIGAVFQVMGALSVASPFGQVGAQRELLQMLAYEPILILVYISIAMTTGSFTISSIYAQNQPLLLSLPLTYLALGYALTIKLRKSPFDISASHHGHPEIVRGFQVDYSGKQLAILELGHWIEFMLILGFCSLFWHTNIIGCLILLFVTYMAEIIIDNISARMTWQWMLKGALGVGVGLCIINIMWLYS